MKKQLIIKRTVARTLCICLLIAFVGVIFVPKTTRGDVVTDTLTVAVGYWGMSLSDYVSAGTFHWSELEANLPIYEEVYSFYQSGEGEEYTAIVDSARGFLVEDLLDYVNIYYGDIYNLQFYVNDHNGIQAAFDRDSLFCRRYYFEDFPFHLEKKYDPETGAFLGYGYDEIWQNAYEVPPMLALEDSWIGFTQEFEHIGPNFESMSAANRFRLLFGQTSPTETLTSASAKYVSCVYVTLWGSPSFGEMPELENSLGSHEVTLQVKVDDLSLKNALSEYMQLNSTDENVMRITGLTYTAVEGYSDLVNVTVSYEIVGEGSASFIADFGGNTEQVIASQIVEVPETEPETESEKETIEPEEQPTSIIPSDQEKGSENQGGVPVSPEPEPVSEGNQEPSSGPAVSPEPELASDNAQEHPAKQETREAIESEPAKEPVKPQSEEEMKPEDTEKNTETIDNERIIPEPDIKGNEQAKEVIEEQVSEAPTDMEIRETELPEQMEYSQLPDQLEEIGTNNEEADLAFSEISFKGFRLSDQKVQLLDNSETEDTIVPAELLPEAEDITQVRVKDSTEENQEEQRRILLWTGVAMAAICLIGAVIEVIVFNYKLHGSLK